MKHTMLHHAGLIRRVLDEKGIIRICELQGYTGISEKELYMAIGWLVCEDKIYLLADTDDQDEWRIILTI